MNKQKGIWAISYIITEPVSRNEFVGMCLAVAVMILLLIF